MELREKYVYTVYKEKSFSKAAEKLFIAQSSLSATIKKTESKLGFLIFDRSQSPVALTPEGKIYIEYLEEIAEDKRVMNQRIAALSKSVSKSISIGGTSFFARKLFPKICCEFYKKHPDTELKIDLGEMYFYRHLLDKLDAGNLDFVIGYICDEEKHTAIPIMDERYIIAARKDLPQIKPLLPYSITKEELLNKNFSDKPLCKASLFKNVTFIDNGTNNVLRTALNGFVDKLSFTSCYVGGTRKNDIYYELMKSGIGAVITTDFTASCFDDNDDIVYFLLDIKNPQRNACIIYKNDITLSPLAEEFVDMVKKIFDLQMRE